MREDGSEGGAMSCPQCDHTGPEDDFPWADDDDQRQCSECGAVFDEDDF